MIMENARIIAKLQTIINTVLTPLIPASGGIALLDFPNYANVGDSAIWLGEIAYFNQHALQPAYVCIQQHEKIPDGTLFLNGGGNFGDIWPQHQEFREEIIERYPDRKIIQLPQSIHFVSDKALRRSATIINKHKDFTLLVRDHNSLAIAKDAFTCRIELCPDMAFCLGKLEKPIQPVHQTLYLLRADKESASEFGVPSDAIAVDWLVDDDLSAIRATDVRQILQLGTKMFVKHSRRELYYRRLAEARLLRGLKLLSSAECVITDRLHACILCTLLDIPHTSLDNCYGKISAFFETWMNEDSLAGLQSR